jgi:hypothetical protein
VEVHIPDLVYAKIMHWIRKAGHYEVSGLGTIVYDKELQIFEVKDVWLLNQKNDGASTDISANAIGKLMHEHHKNKWEGELQFWWHSHAGMDVFWSQTDLDTIKQLAQGGYFLSTVFNNREEMLSSFYMTDPMVSFADGLETFIVTSVTDKQIEKALGKLGLKPKSGKMDSLTWLLEPLVDDAVRAEWDAEYVAKVKEVKEYSPAVLRHASHKGFSGHNPLVSLPFAKHDDDDDLPTDAFPDWQPTPEFASLSEMDEEDMREMQEDIEVTLEAMPDLSREELIEMYECDYPFIGDIIDSLIRGHRRA